MRVAGFAWFSSLIGPLRTTLLMLAELRARIIPIGHKDQPEEYRQS
jgi:hypothetical protein